MHSGTDHTSAIRSPVIKSMTAIGAAAGANSGSAQNFAVKAAETVAESMVAQTHDMDTFWFIMSLPWGQIASMVAAFYTLALLAEWLWKKPVKWVLVRFGVIKEDRDRVTDSVFAQMRKH